jgi:thioredoxin reductase (NADPH)
LWSGLQPGGQLTITTDVENYPGFAEPIMGPWLVEQMALQASRVGVVSEERIADRVDLSSYPFAVFDDNQNLITTKSIIIATGSKARWLGLENETRLRGKGVSGCATCDGFFFRNQIVGVVGGGNTAAEEALFLTKHAEKVVLIHRRDSLRAEHLLSSRVLNNPKIEILWNTRVLDVLGTHTLESVLLENTQSKAQHTLNLQGLFIAIGHDPATSLFQKQIHMDEDGYIITSPHSTHTSVKGVFAAGDVADKNYRQAVTAAGTGCMAALDAAQFLEHFNAPHPS